MDGLSGSRGPNVNGQRNPNDAGFAGLRRNNFQFAVMRLDDFPADGQAESKADIARGKKWRGHLFGGFGGKAGAVVLHFNLQVLMRRCHLRCAT